MKNALIKLFDLKPIHVGDSTEKPKDGQKAQRKQKHGRIVE